MDADQLRADECEEVKSGATPATFRPSSHLLHYLRVGVLNGYEEALETNL